MKERSPAERMLDDRGWSVPNFLRTFDIADHSINPMTLRPRPGESTVDCVRRELDEEVARAKEHPLNAFIGYPKFIDDLHGPLWEAYDSERRAGAHSINDVNRQDEIDSIMRFFGFSATDGKAMVLPSAMGAVTAAIDRLSKPHSTVLLLDPAFEAYEEIVGRAGESALTKRRAVHVDCSHEPDVSRIEEAIEKARKQDYPVSLIVVNSPRNPDMEEYERAFLSKLAQVADKKGITILYDEVFILHGSRASIKRGGNGWPDENHISSDIPRSSSNVVIRDTGKILPDPFAKLAAVQVSNGALPNGGQMMIDAQTRAYFNSPSVLDIYALRRLLHGDYFPSFVEDVKRLNERNFEHLADELMLPIRFCGPFSLVDMPMFGPLSFTTRDLSRALRDASLSAQRLRNYYPDEAYEAEAIYRQNAIRIPLSLSPEDFDREVVVLQEDIRVMERTESRRRELEHLERSAQTA